MFTFFDTETTGKPINYKAQMSDLDNWPRVIQLAWLLCDNDGNHINQKEYLIKPDGWVIPVEPFWVEHGFATEINEAKGIPLPVVLAEFTADLEQSEYLVSHNMAFDKNVLGAEMIRYQVTAKKLVKICTMNSSIQFCQLPFPGQRNWYSKSTKSYKWPKLDELHIKLFGRSMEGGHQAGEDVTALKNCFFELVRIGVISLPAITAGE